MGVISRRVLPACGNLCVCCPELRARSRQPVKRYKKLLADIFPKSQDEAPNDRKIGKLSEYAAKNPLRIPKIATGLEQRGYKELRSEHYGSVKVVMRAYSKLLSACRDQMPLFATSALGMIRTLLDQVRQDSMRVLGCLTLVDFLHNQTDGTYIHNLEPLVSKLCDLGREKGEESRRLPLRAAGLQALSAMVSFMGKYSYISSEFEEIVAVILDNYDASVDDLESDIQDRGETHHNWVKEVLKGEGRGAVAVMRGAITKLSLHRESSRYKDPSCLTRMEAEAPKVWSQICVQNMARLAKEATTVRRVLEPMFQYFDTGKLWSREHGLVLSVLRDMQYFMEKSGNDQLLLPIVVRHLDHKSVSDNPIVKTNIVEVAGNLAYQSKAKASVADVGAMSDLLRHLRRSLQFSVEVSNSSEGELLEGHQALQAAIEECLMELAKRVGDTGPVLDMMAATLEKLSLNPIVARTTIEAVSVLAHCVTSVPDQSYTDQLFPEALFQELLQAMVHPDVETAVRAHGVFALLLVSASVSRDEDFDAIHPMPGTSRTALRNTSAFASAAALFERLRREKTIEREEIGTQKFDRDELRREKEEGLELVETGTLKQKGTPGLFFASPSRLFGLKLSMERTMELSMERSRSMAHLRKPSNIPKDIEMTAARLSGHQAGLLLSTLWVEAVLPANVPSSYEAIAHTYILALLFSRAKTSSHSTFVRAFQLALSLRSLALDPHCTQPSPSRRRSLFSLASAMLVFAGRAYNIPRLANLVKTSLKVTMKDPYLELLEDNGLKASDNHGNAKDYGSASDDHDALTFLSTLSLAADQTSEALVELIVRNCTLVLETERSAVSEQLLQPFSAEGLGLGSQLYLETPLSHGSPLESRDSLSFDEIIPHTGTSLEDDLVSETSVGDLPRLLACVPVPALTPQAMGVTQLLEAALETAGQVSSPTVSEARLSYSAMASQCEAFGAGSRKKMSQVLQFETDTSSLLLTLPERLDSSALTGDQQSSNQMQLEANNEHKASGREISSGQQPPKKVPLSPFWLTSVPLEPWQVFRLPPATPYDNFLKAACC